MRKKLKKYIGLLLLMAAVVLICVSPTFTVSAKAGDGWEFDPNTGTLTVMSDTGMASWHEGGDNSGVDALEIKSVMISMDVILEGGGKNAFSDCTNLETIFYHKDLDVNNAGIPDSAAQITYEKNDDGSIVIYNAASLGNQTAVILPDTICGADVTSIRIWAFMNTELTSITIPSSVTSIGDKAFYGCSKLTSVIFPSGSKLESIGKSAFYNCSMLASIEIPDSVDSIESMAFSGCTGLTSVKLPNNIKSIAAWTFDRCSELTSIDISDGVTSIGEDAFSACSKLVSVKLSNELVSIDARAFASCSKLASIEFPDGVTSIGDNAFSTCFELTHIEIPSSVTSVGVNAFDYENIKTIYCPESLGKLSCTEALISYIKGEDGKVTVSGAKLFEKVAVTVPDKICGADVISIKAGTFKDCKNLTSIDIPENISLIESNTFENCTGLSSIKLPSGVTSIGESAFAGCTGLTSIDIPESVSSIAKNTFKNCEGFTSIKLPSKLNSIGEGAFSGCIRLYSINIPENISFIEADTFQNCSMLTSITIPSGVTSIGNSAFYGCTGLTSITIPSGVTTIETSVFLGCTGLTSITIPSGVTTIETSVFLGCTGLTSITIPSGVTTIGNSAFADCTGLTSIEIPDSVALIKPLAFYGCTGLTSVKLPGDITSIEDNTFYNCTELTSIVIPDGVASVGEDAFTGCSNLTITYCDGSDIANALPDNIPMLSYKKVQDKVIITDVMPVIGEDDKYKFITVPETIDSVKPEFPENVQEIIKDSPHVHRGSDIVTCMGKFCEICGMAYGETDPENHSFKHYISNNNATCTEDGTETATCDWCHTATDEQEIAGTAKGHSGGEATCTHRAICEECDAEYGELNPENHSFKHYISNNNATCTEDGTETATCDWCHTAIDEREEANSAKGHSANTEWKNNENVHWHICIDCGDKTDITEHTEDSGTVTKEPTETESGVKTFRCTVCGYEIRTETIPALSHTHVYSSDWKTNAENHWHECACGERLNYSEHVFDSGTITRYPTNTKAGEIEYRCNICGYVMQTEIIIPENPKTGEEEQPWKIMFFCSLVTIVCSLFLKNRKNKIV